MSLWGSITSALPDILSVAGTVAQAFAKPQVYPSTVPVSGAGGLSQMANIMLGGAAGAGGARRMKVGRLSGQQIPAGYTERMSPSGVIYLARARRRRGISGKDLTNYKRVSRVLKRYSRKTH